MGSLRKYKLFRVHIPYLGLSEKELDKNVGVTGLRKLKN